MRSGDSETLDIGVYKFLAANPEGSELLLEADAGGEDHELLLYDTASATATPLLKLAHPPEEVEISEDLSTIYLRSEEPLTGEAPALSDDAGATGRNVYRYDVGSHTLHFLFQASSGHTGDSMEMQVSPDGRELYFTSTQVGGIPAGDGVQVYRYDRAAGVVQCVSCASPFDSEPKLGAVYRANVAKSDAWNLPASSNGDYVFFDTPAALVPEDVDGEIAPIDEHGYEDASSEYSPSSDVYEWRRDGVDGCDAVEGCLALITSGDGGLKNELLGTDASGRDVFFATHLQLAASDLDTAGDVYDARIGGGEVPPAPAAVECEGDACSTPLGAPLDQTPASLTFSGAGDLVPEPAKNATAKSKKHKAARRKAAAHRKRRAGRRAGHPAGGRHKQGPRVRAPRASRERGR
jgi:hypothetical protein